MVFFGLLLFLFCQKCKKRSTQCIENAIKFNCKHFGTDILDVAVSVNRIQAIRVLDFAWGAEGFCSIRIWFHFYTEVQRSCGGSTPIQAMISYCIHHHMVFSSTTHPIWIQQGQQYIAQTLVDCLITWLHLLSIFLSAICDNYKRIYTIFWVMCVSSHEHQVCCRNWIFSQCAFYQELNIRIYNGKLLKVNHNTNENKEWWMFLVRTVLVDSSM